MFNFKSILVLCGALAATLTAPSGVEAKEFSVAAINTAISESVVEAGMRLTHTVVTIANLAPTAPIPPQRPAGLGAKGPVSEPVGLGAFRSVAISAGTIPMSSKWFGVTSSDYAGLFTGSCDLASCSTPFAERVQAIYSSAEHQDPLQMLDRVNRGINAALTYREDSAHWGVGDYWATPTEVARTGFGDCEDYATTKMWMLRALGFSPDQLQVVVLQDTRRRIYHAVLAVHFGGERYILDNLSNGVRTDLELDNYLPLVSFVAEKTFIHGFDASRTVTASLPSDLSSVQPGMGL